MTSIAIGGKTYILQYGLRAAEELQELADRPILAAMAALGQGDLKVLTIAFYAGLKIHHPDMTFDHARDVLDVGFRDGPGLAPIAEAVATALGKLFNRATQADGETGETKKKASGRTKTAG